MSKPHLRSRSDAKAEIPTSPFPPLGQSSLSEKCYMGGKAINSGSPISPHFQICTQQDQTGMAFSIGASGSERFGNSPSNLPKRNPSPHAVVTVSGEDLSWHFKEGRIEALKPRSGRVKSGFSAPHVCPRHRQVFPSPHLMSPPHQLFSWSGPPRFLLVNHRVVLHSPRAKTSTETDQRMFQAIMGCIF